MNSNFSKLQSKQKYRVETYCRIAFNSLKANVDEWFINRNCKDTVRAITHSFYNTVHSLSVPSGLISVEAVKKKKLEPEWALCKDHCYSPQFIGRMIMDNSDKYLNDYDLYRKLFVMACTTIIVIPEENRSLSFLTSNRNNEFKIYAHTDKKYQHLNIKLLEKANGSEWYVKDMKPASNYIETPKELIEYETQFLVV
jgi:hypothetical protein